MEDTFTLTKAYESLLLEASASAMIIENWERMGQSGAQKSENNDNEDEVYECSTRTKAQNDLAVQFLIDNFSQQS
ncbi:unnamed protein product [Clonostachys chloroleuca]|uniref:Uncharacterized protein n=1 Tax=Clonostachys chloroleuca TaxID=1926264 RepID=A0AA35LS32_9HYPO|nr:unnamed protein product [Clonostachys chloroleuca]